MKFAIYSVLTFAFCFNIAQADVPAEDLTENQVRLMMLNEDLEKYFDRATLIQNTLVKGNFSKEQNCVYVSELETLTINLGITIAEYANVPGSNDNPFFDMEPSLRQMHAAHLQTLADSMGATLPIFIRNNQCQ